MKVGVRMLKSVKVPLFCRRARDVYAIWPLILWHLFGASFWLWGGIVELVSNVLLELKCPADDLAI